MLPRVISLTSLDAMMMIVIIWQCLLMIMVVGINANCYFVGVIIIPIIGILPYSTQCKELPRQLKTEYMHWSNSSYDIAYCAVVFIHVEGNISDGGLPRASGNRINIHFVRYTSHLSEMLALFVFCPFLHLSKETSVSYWHKYLFCKKYTFVT